LELSLIVNNDLFGNKSAGSPFTVYAPGKYKNEAGRSWNYAIKPGDRIDPRWSIADFENNGYQLRVYGPNGFFRELSGNTDDPIYAGCVYERSKDKKHLTGNIALQIMSTSDRPLECVITDNAYKTGVRKHNLDMTADHHFPEKGNALISLNLDKSFGWYDITVTVTGNNTFMRRYAGRVETGKASKTDPFMGRVV
jgi:phospholipase C